VPITDKISVEIDIYVSMFQPTFIIIILLKNDNRMPQSGLYYKTTKNKGLHTCKPLFYVDGRGERI
jgi:hypothetical protein